MGRKKEKVVKGGWSEGGEGLGSPFAGLSGKAPAAVVKPAGDGPGKAGVGSADAGGKPSVEGGGEAGVPRRAVLRVERKGRGGKTATVITHLGLEGDALAAFGRELRTAMGCGGQVEGDALVLQGDQRERAAAWLEGRGVRKVTRS